MRKIILVIAVLMAFATISCKGPEGKPGIPGPAGSQGPMGPAGDRGAMGLQGPIGKTGEQGIPGKDGKPGADGKNGIDGKPGVDGKQGIPGTEGKQGPVGPQGIQGIPGKEGPIGAARPQYIQSTPPVFIYPAGGVLTVIGGGFTPGMRITLTVDYTMDGTGMQQSGTSTYAGADGSIVNAQINIPMGIQRGHWTVKAFQSGIVDAIAVAFLVVQ